MPPPAPAAGRLIRRRASVGDLPVGDFDFKGGKTGSAPKARKRGTKRAARRKSKDTDEDDDEGPKEVDLQEQRRALRHHPDVCAALDRWWNATDADGNGVIDHDEYIVLSVALYRVLVADGDEDGALLAAEDDWEEDLGDADAMTAELFVEGIVQIADMWTDTVGELDYLIFFVHCFL